MTKVCVLPVPIKFPSDSLLRLGVCRQAGCCIEPGKFEAGSDLILARPSRGEKTMKRYALLGGLLAAASGCVSTEGGAPAGAGGAGGSGKYMSNAFDSGSAMAEQAGIHNGVRTARSVPGLQGPWGTPVPVAAVYSNTAPTGRAAAMAMLASSQPLDVIQQTKFGQDMARSNGISQSGYNSGLAGSANGLLPGSHVPSALGISPPGVPAMPGMPGAPTPANVMIQRGPGGPLPLPGTIRQVNGPGMPGMGGMMQPMPPNMPGVVAANGAIPLGGMGGSGMTGPAGRTQILFNELPGMKISWFAAGADGKPGFTKQSISAPGRYNFAQGAVYRLKVSDLPNMPEVDLYPTMEVVPANGKSATFLAHSPVPVSITQEDLSQVSAGNFVVKVIYLPDPQFQDLALAGGPDELVSSRLEPGVDPIVEAQKRGSILAILRLGKIDLELPHSPAMDSAPGSIGSGSIHNSGPAGPVMPTLVPTPGPVAPGALLPMLPMLPSGVNPPGKAEVVSPGVDSSPAVGGTPPLPLVPPALPLVSPGR